MPKSLQDQLIAIVKQITDADRRIGDQIGLVESMAWDGRDTRQAMSLLADLERFVGVLEERRASIEDQIRRQK